MVITRKIELWVNESDPVLREMYYQKLYETRRIAVSVANMAMSHLFMLDSTLPYLSAEDRESLTYLGVKGNKATKRNAPYVVASETFKGKADMGMVSSVLQNVQKMYQDDRKRGMWNRSLRSYKDSMPIPFQSDRFLSLSFVEGEREGRKHKDCIFTLIGIPFKMAFGKDRSGNRVIVERMLRHRAYDCSGGTEGSPTGYKMCTSSIQIVNAERGGKQKSKIYLLLCVDIPTQTVELDPNKTLYAVLGVMNPILCTVEKGIADAYGKYVEAMRREKDVDMPAELGRQFWAIGTKEEYNHRRIQIQAAVHRCQMENKYTRGGQGRKKKCKAIDRWHRIEKNYISSKLHLYSKELVKIAVDNKCGNIRLLNQHRREKKAKADNLKGYPFVLRNWSYYGLKDKIAYKSKLSGIRFFSDKEELTEEKTLDSVMLSD